MTAVCESHGIQSADWQDWGRQMRHRSCDVESLSRWIDPTEDECKAVTELCAIPHVEIVRLRVRPYYVYQAQLLEGTAHFRTSIEEGVELFRALRGRTSGFAIPQYVLDTPYGKVPLDHPYLRGREGDVVVVESYDGRLWREPNPKRPPVAKTGVAKTGVAVIRPQ